MKSTVLATLVAAASAQQGYISYSTVTGYFLQDLASTNTTGFDYTAVNFGLINQTYPGISSSDLTQWQQFKLQVDTLNANSPLDTVYKVFWLGRHGEGYHNAAETFYGTPAWNCYWSELNGNATANWADADLTPNGIRQAQIANSFWKSEIANQKIPYPQSYYTSPLTRCLRTANLTFSDIPTPKYYPFVPEVKEFFREGISVHTCDRRSNKTYIHNLFPSYTFEAGFTEYDELWNANYAETSTAQDVRSKKALDSVFTSNDHTWISVTSHSGEIASILRVLGHRTFSLSTGAIIPVLVKAQFLPAASAPAVSSAPASTSVAFCTALPATSISGGACVCPGGASTGLASNSVRTASASATSGAVSKTLSASSSLPQITGSSSASKTGLQPSASSTKKRACKSKSKSKAAASTGAATKSKVNSTKKPKACKTKSKSKLTSASTGGVAKPSTSSSVSAGKTTSVGSSKTMTTSVVKSSSSTAPVVTSKTSTSLAAVVTSKTSSSSTSTTCTGEKASTSSVAGVKTSSSVAGVVSSTSGAAGKSSSTSTSAKPSSSVSSAKTSSSGAVTSVKSSVGSTTSIPAASQSLLSTSKPKACKTRTYASYYNEYEG